MNKRDFIKIAFMLILLGLNSFFAHHASRAISGGSQEPSEYRTVVAMKMGSYVILIMALGIFVHRAVCWDGSYAHQTPLTLFTLFTHVYGLGLFVFVMSYSITGVSDDATLMFFLAMMVFSADDLFERNMEATLRRSMLFFSSLLGGAAIIMASAQGPFVWETVRAALHEKWLVLMFGAVCPGLCPYIFLGIRRRRHYTPLTVYDFVNFAMPFATLLAVQSLLFLSMVPHGPDPQAPLLANGTLNSTHWEAQADLPELYLPLLALTMTWVTIMVVQNILHYSTVDLLSTLSVVTAFKAVAVNPGGQCTPAVFVAASLSFVFRLYTCLRDENDMAGMAYLHESEEAQEESEILRKLDLDLDLSEP
jgi:hypothetical protein